MTPEASAARIWLIRERTEHEAAFLFDVLSKDLALARAPAQLVELAARCAADERVHATHCRAIVGSLEPGLAPLAPELRPLGPADPSPARRALYASVALGCVTESLSTALLIALRPHAALDVVRGALDVILEDEIRHSRLGWAYLAHAASRGDVGWIAPLVPAMLRAALDAEHAGEPSLDLRGFGILGRAEVARICRETIDGAIVPGLARYGIAA